MHPLIPKSPHQRLMYCVGIASLVHAMALISFHWPSGVKNTAPQPVLDIVLKPLPPVASPNELKQVQTKALAQSHSLNSVKPQKEKGLKKRTISMAHHLPQDEPYLSRWQAHIEEIGSHHVAQAKQNFSGSLRLMVAVNKDGSLREIDLRQSSGNKALDQTAIQIVTRAAPFEPLPTELAQDIDVLEIIRTWQFNPVILAKG